MPRDHTPRPSFIFRSPLSMAPYPALEELRPCRERDSSRMARALLCAGPPANDVSLADLSLTDVFYIGGTGRGTLGGGCGDPRVGRSANSSPMKGTVRLAAKGCLPGVRFEALFEDGLT